MAITSIKTGSSFTNLVKYNDFLGPNSAYIPSSYESIASETLSTTSSLITFDNIPQTYSALHLRLSVRNTQNNQIQMRFNNNTSATYYTHYLRGDGTTAVAGANATSGSFVGEMLFALSTANINSASIIDIQDYTSSTKNKTVRVFHGREYNNTSGVVQCASGLFVNTTSITRIDFFPDASTFASGSTFALYGIKG